MSEGDSMKTVRDGVAILGEVIKAAGDNPNVKAAGSELGQTALTITKTINNALLPLAAVNFAFDKAKAYFAGKFQQEIAAKTAEIPPEDIIEPKPSLAGPALQGLAFAHEEPNLKEMYLNLLAVSMNLTTAGNAHPAFVEIIRQLTSTEARLAAEFLKIDGGQPIAEIQLTGMEGGGYQTLYRHLLPLMAGDVHVEDMRIPAMVDNWVRLGLVAVHYDKHLMAPNAYAWVPERPEYKRLTSRETHKHKLNTVKGIIARTALGKQFGEAVGLAVLPPKKDA
jgi:hypothetical protein